MAAEEIPELQKVIKDYIEGELVSQEISRLTDPGENFGSILFKVDIKVNKGDKDKIYHTVAKCVPPNPTTQKTFNTEVTFPAEIAWYSEVIPTLKEFQKQQGVKNVIDCFCDFYGARLGLDPSKKFDEHGLILLENLVASGYKNEDRFKGMNQKTANEVLKSMAAFHAVPLAIKVKNPQLFKHKIQKHLDGLNQKLPDSNIYAALYKPLIDFIAENPETANLAEKVRKDSNLFPFGREGKSQPWSTALHTDFWTNNMMVKDEESTPKVKIVDLQTTGYGTLTSDIILFILTSIEINLISQHFDNFLKVYHNAFIAVLKELNIDTKVFAYNNFLEEVDIEAKKMLSKCLFLIILCNAKKGTSDDVSNKEYDHKKNLQKMFENLNEIQKEKIAFVVKFFETKGWI